MSSCAGSDTGISDEGEEVSDFLEANAAEDGALGDRAGEPLERLGELFGDEGGAGGEDDLVALFGLECFPIGDLAGDIAFEDVPDFGEKEAAFVQLGFDHREQFAEVRVSLPDVFDLGIAEAKDFGTREDFVGGGLGDFEAGMASDHFEESDAGGEDVSRFAGREAGIDV
jgi:hypothetical protein